MRKFLLFLAAAAAMITSCGKEAIPEINPSEERIAQKSEPEGIPLEKALATLESFLAENETGMTATRTMTPRRISSVCAYYGRTTGTRSSDESGDTTARAYIVNFEETSGFAVL